MDAWRYGIYLLVFTSDISLVRYQCEHSKINSISPRAHVLFSIYGHGCSTGKYTTRKIHTKLYQGLEWRIYRILPREDIDDVISCFFTAVCDWVVVCLCNKKNITR